jgi:multidrug efflux pump subunit AcrB
MSRKQKILIVVVGILIILALFYGLFLRESFSPQSGTTKTNVNVVALPPVTLPNSTTVSATVPEASQEEKLRSSISRLAAAFAERYGSYSNQGNFENLLDLESLMTEKMWVETDNFIQQNEAGTNGESTYFGITTKAISVNIVEIDEGAGTAQITVGTQRRESSGSMADSSVIKYEDLELIFQRINDEWKVDEAKWVKQS